ncbi:MAG: stage III sporulation protein AF [Ruminococcaceae bacterium]|nr:stage III sporulation protein AF [Oscillospiraceae bacterium]
MEFIREYIMSIIVVILFSVLLEMIMPGSSFKKYIKLVVGLLIMFAIIKPVIHIPSLKNMELPYLTSEQVFSEQSEQVHTSVEGIQDNLIKKHFSQSLSNEIQDAIYKKFSVTCQVLTEFDGKQITVHIAGDEEKRQEIEGFIKTTYDVSVAEWLAPKRRE